MHMLYLQSITLIFIERKSTMKKLFSLLLMLTLLFSTLSFVSCTEAEKETLAGKTPEELYEECLEKVSIAKEYSTEVSQTITFDDKDLQTQKQTMYQKFNGTDGYAKLESKTAPEINFESWYVDGISYVSVEGYKIKGRIDKEEFIRQYLNADPGEGMLLDVPKSYFEGIKFEKEKGDWVLKFLLSKDKFNDVFENMGLGAVDITDDIEYNVYFDDDGNIQKIITEFDMKANGYTAHCYSEAKVTLENVTITPPEDADSYQEVSLY